MSINFGKYNGQTFDEVIAVTAQLGDYNSEQA